MKILEDKLGDSYEVAITFAVARRLKNREENPIDLLNPEDLSRVLADPYERFDLLYEIVREQAEAISVDVDAFDRRVATPKCYTDAHEALTEALSDFFHRMGRPDLVSMMTLASESVEKLQQLAVEKATGPKARARIEQEIQKASEELDASMTTLGNASTDGQPSAAS